MATNADEVCAACGKGGDDLKRCTACKLVKYCCVDCQRAHRPKHKKECRRRAAELHDDILFKQPPSQEECPICFLELPIDLACYKSCCGKIVCEGCNYASAQQSEGILCPFCREPVADSIEEENIRIERRAELEDPEALSNMGRNYSTGRMGLQQDMGKGIVFLHKAVELGSIDAKYVLGSMYFNGYGVRVDTKKANHYHEIAAIEGHLQARNDLGVMEGGRGNHHRAMKHFMISANSGNDDALKSVQSGYRNGLVTKNDFEKTLRAHKKSRDELKSEWRDKANAIDQLMADGSVQN